MHAKPVMVKVEFAIFRRIKKVISPSRKVLSGAPDYAALLFYGINSHVCHGVSPLSPTFAPYFLFVNSGQ
ncbi:MAG: hypothetical protein LAN18_16200 [Acidobacteriia bacterium]|nr:hypothetical protein [Terriglobia bacterium]